MTTPAAILAAAYADPRAIRVRRFAGNPIIRPDMLPGEDGLNINGPSLIRTPDWLPHPLGRYLLYFGHHSGRYIRLAYADAVEGPWRLHAPGVLPLGAAPMVRHHLASPDVLVDHDARQLRMYFHGPADATPGGASGQQSFVALSSDGLHFEPQPQSLGIFYFRVFFYRQRYYALAKGARLYSSDDGLTGFVDHGDVFPAIPGNDPHYNAPGSVRHTAVHVEGDTLYIFYTQIGDAPEIIKLTTIDLSQPVDAWRVGQRVDLLRPELDYEGADVPVTQSRAGAQHGRSNALRDPGVFVEDDRVYLLYSVAGECGIAGAALTLP